jgi:hypothetical protein
MKALSKRQVGVVVAELKQQAATIQAVMEVEQEHLDELEEDSEAAGALEAEVEMLEGAMEAFEDLIALLTGTLE